MLTRRLAVPLAAGCLAGAVEVAAMAPAAAVTARAVTARAVTARAVTARAVTARAVTTRAAPAGFGPGAGRQVLRDLQSAWQITRGSGVTVAVLGGRVDAGAPGLAGKVTWGPAFGPAAHPSSSDSVFSTVFASVVAGSGPSAANATGTLGLAPAARILSVPVRPARQGASWQSADAAAIRYAAAHGAQVIDVVLAGFQNAKNLDSAVQYALSRNAVVLVLEFARRSELKLRQYPSSIPGVFGAAAATLPGMTAPSTRLPTPANDSILITAPGNVLTGSGPLGPGYTLFNASASAAWLTATVALIKSVYPHLPPALVARALAVSARDHPPGGYTTKEGFGLIDPVGALRAVGALLKLRASAAAGPGVAAPGARLAPGPAPGVIDAVPRSMTALVGSAAAVVLGLLLLALAAIVSRRRRSRATGPPVAGSPPAGPPPAGPSAAAGALG